MASFPTYPMRGTLVGCCHGGGGNPQPESNPRPASVRPARTNRRRVSGTMLPASIGPPTAAWYEAVHTPTGTLFLPSRLHAGVAGPPTKFGLTGPKGDRMPPASA